VTGGPDLSLLEVNEASCVIQEAAHEDANIIFGAVVDPTLTGKVKITVIATGFDRKPATRGVPAAALQTPVDLSNYAAHAARSSDHGGRDIEAPAAAAGSAAAHTSSSGGFSQPSGFAPPQFTINRRAVLDLSLPTAAARPATTADPNAAAGDPNLDLSSPLDVPAFLRRQS
jgi:cell division protein FtsZ